MRPLCRGTAPHSLLALGSLGAAVIAGLPLGILCHQVPRLRGGTGTLNVIQTIPRLHCLES
jgi:osmoprotectant transport system permease protein